MLRERGYPTLQHLEESNKEVRNLITRMFSCNTHEHQSLIFEIFGSYQPGKDVKPESQKVRITFGINPQLRSLIKWVDKSWIVTHFTLLYPITYPE
jgi:hypothetical protein